ncbi:hypothetical protein MPSEU_000472800 [Mayamaea pseudoterrestris]|nr:hypothetical protein MPSEU_000472800 [Mayamaea pseudoterrestris]
MGTIPVLSSLIDNPQHDQLSSDVTQPSVAFPGKSSVIEAITELHKEKSQQSVWISATDTFFSPYMPVLVKLTLVSGIVHQLCFCAFSSLPFAIGQVQDAGLIFLSNMASDMVKAGMEQDDSADRILATVTVSLSLCTVVLGVGLVVIGRLRLAQYVRMLPTCVIGGYLAFIGWFCGIAGIGLMANVSQATLTPTLVLRHSDKVAPGIAGGMVIYALVRRYRHMAVLPACIVVMLGIFYMTMWLFGATFDDVTRDGWIRTTDEPPQLRRTWDYLRLDLVNWSGLPRLVTSELGMIFIVALSSSLDVAAIELELNDQLDYNHELVTVGVSNIVSGLTGGYTGSYIFSQSIFSLRAGIRSRVAGLVLAICQIVVLILPFSLLQYVPNFFFGALLSMICIDLMYEWLWDVRTTITQAEHMISLSTFLLIQLFNVEWGILLGVCLYAICWKTGIDVGDLKISRQQRDNEVKYGAT